MKVMLLNPPCFPRIGKGNKQYHYLMFNSKDSEILLSMFKRIFAFYENPETMCYKLGKMRAGNDDAIKKARSKKNEYKRKWRKKRSDKRIAEKEKKYIAIGNDIRKLYWQDGLTSTQIGNRSGFYGKGHSIESKRKISLNRWQRRSFS